MNEYLIPITVNTLPLISELKGRQGMFVLPDGSININKKDGTWLHINKQSDHAGILKTTDTVSVQPGFAKWFWAGPGTYNNVASGFIIDKLGIISYDGAKWSFVNVDILSNPKQLFDPNDNMNSAAMKATDVFMNSNLKRYMQNAIDLSIGSNQTEIVEYGKGTGYTTPFNSGVWVGNHLTHLSGILKSISFNALKAEKYQFVIVTVDINAQKLTFTGPYFDFTPVQTGVNTFNVPAGITLAPNQTVFLSLNTVGKIGYTSDSTIVDCEFLETAGGADVGYTPHAGFIPLVMKIEVPTGRIPFAFDEMTMFVYNGINGVNVEEATFTSVINIKENVSYKYTKLTGPANFTKGSKPKFGPVVRCKLTGGSVNFTSDFVPEVNTPLYDREKTNIIYFYEEYGKIVYSIEHKTLEPI